MPGPTLSLSWQCCWCFGCQATANEMLSAVPLVGSRLACIWGMFPADIWNVSFCGAFPSHPNLLYPKAPYPPAHAWECWCFPNTQREASSNSGLDCLSSVRSRCKRKIGGLNSTSCNRTACSLLKTIFIHIFTRIG